MIRKLLILLALLGCLAIMRPEVVVRADNCSNCSATYSDCSWSASNLYDDCIGIIGFWMCDDVWRYDEGACDTAYSNCVAQNCGFSAHGGPSVACDGDTLMGYSEIGYSFYAGFMESCSAGGADAFSGTNLDTSGFSNCMANSGPEPNQDQCCRAQIILYIEQNCRCNFDPRNSDCKKCYVF